VLQQLSRAVACLPMHGPPQTGAWQAQMAEPTAILLRMSLCDDHSRALIFSATKQ